MTSRQARADARRIVRGCIPISDSFAERDYDGTLRAEEFMGTWFALDPCGRYHHVLSPNGATRACEAFWDELEREADKQGYYITTGEGDPCDVIIGRVIEDEEVAS